MRLAKYFTSTKLYYSLVYPFLTYAIVAWSNTYQTNIKPLLILQKRAIRIITFSKFDKHSSPLFKQTKILKLFDLIKIQISLFMYKFHNNRLPTVFDSFFIKTIKIHKNKTRLSTRQAYALPKTRTNYIFSMKFTGAKIWNEIDKDLKTLSMKKFVSSQQTLVLIYLPRKDGKLS